MSKQQVMDEILSAIDGSVSLKDGRAIVLNEKIFREKVDRLGSDFCIGR